MHGWIVIPVSVVYLGVLFFIAWYGDRRRQWFARWRPWIYSLSIAVYCTSWTFYGTVGQAAANSWSFLPIYLAPMLVFLFGRRILARLILTSKREHITSIADFIAARYGKSQGLAVVVTLIAVVGILPYIALQLRAIIMGLQIVAPSLGDESDSNLVTGIVVAALALFTMLFGTRHTDNTEHHRGMMMAIAFESVFKLLAFLAVGLFITSLVFTHADLSWSQLAAADYTGIDIPALLIHTLLAMLAIFCLPRAFHTIVVENEQAQDLNHARRIFPFYLLLMALFVLPVAQVGLTLLPQQAPDTYMVSIPMATGYQSIAVLAFLGGASAASGMVMVSTIALAIMVSNDLVMPLLLRRMRLISQSHNDFSVLLLRIRRGLILLLLAGAWGFFHALDSIPSLSVIGFLSFAAITQFAPALLGGMYWRQGNRKGVYVGLASGFTLWLVCLMEQTGLLAGDAHSNVLLWIITPPAFLTQLGINRSDWGMLLSVVVNSLCYFVVSLLTNPSLSERLQSASFVGTPLPDNESISLYQSRVTVGELEMLAARFVGRARVKVAFAQYWSMQSSVLMPSQQAPASLIRHTERMLAGVFGASSAKLVLTSALQGRNMPFEDVATIVDEASELYDFSRGLLQGAIEHIGQGISVVDKHLRLVAWNRRYLELFNFPAGLIQVGRPIADVIYYNAQRGLCGPGDCADHVRRRIAHLQQGTRHTSSRVRPDGRVIEVQGNPMPGGGFVMSFSDITVFRNAEIALKNANEMLEERVQQRTCELEQLNKKLVLATQKSDQESRSKSRFLAAVSHDLMQPLNAARLFASSLSEIARDGEVQHLSDSIESALTSAEELIGDLLDISRLQSGKMSTNIHGFAVSDLLERLNAEFQALARQQGIQFTMVPSGLLVRSDPKLLRRIVQNFLTNAFRYNPNGKVLLGVRRAGSQVRIDVWDNGEGIEYERQQEIFEEFNRGANAQNEQGLGLGLAIAQGIARMLNHQISLRSWPGRGSVFSVTLDKADTISGVAETISVNDQNNIVGLKVLCVDNEPEILAGMNDLLGRWGCEVRTATDIVSSLKALDGEWIPDVVLSDYRLEHQRTGLEVLQQCRLRLGNRFKGVIISADRTAEVLEGVEANGFSFIAKPVKPLKLRAVLRRSS